jgi:hypothetical protein
MENKERFNRERNIVKAWQELEPHREDLHKILMNQKKVRPIDSVIIYQCIATVAENICIHEESIKNETNLIDVKSEVGTRDKDVVMQDIMGCVKYLSVAFDGGRSLTDRLDAVEKIRNTAWLTAFKMKSSLNDLLSSYMDGVEDENIGYVFSCISLVLLELDMKEEEARLLNELYG